MYEDFAVVIQRAITSVEAKTLGEMTLIDAQQIGMSSTPMRSWSPATDSVRWWNARYPEPWDAGRFCWVLEVKGNK